MAKAPRRGPFPTTRWSVVLTAADEGEGPRRALHELCAAYWVPLYAYLRRSGMSVADAEDTVQGFISSLLDGPAITGVDRDRGRFRSYLLGALRNYLQRQRARANAVKRGGGLVAVSAAAAEVEIPDDRTPEGAYAYAWAMAILERAEAAVASAYAAKGKSALFDALQPTLMSGDAPNYRALAERVGMSEGAMRVAAHRIRSRFGDCLREEVAHTVSSKADVEAELRAVIQALEGPGH